MGGWKMLDRDLQQIVTALGDTARVLQGRTILVTGGCGFLGQWFQSFFAFLNQHALDDPCRVIVVDNFVMRKPAEVCPFNGITLIEADVIDKLLVDEPIDYIIHAAGIASPYYYRKYPLETLEVATLGTKNALELAADQRVKSMLFFSSSEIYGDPDPRHVPTPESYRGNVASLGPRACYDESKRLGETLCYVFHKMHGVNVKIVRPFNVYGPGLAQTDYRVVANLTSRALSGQPLRIYGDGQQTRTFCYISDALAGFLQALLLGTPGEAYNIGNERPEISMLDLARILERVVGRPLEVDLVEYPDSYPPDEPMRRCPDLTKARAQLGYAPSVPLEEGLRRFLDWAETHYERNHL